MLAREDEATGALPSREFLSERAGLSVVGASLYLLIRREEEAEGLEVLVEARVVGFSSSESESSALMPERAYDLASRSFALLSLSILL